MNEQIFMGGGAVAPLISNNAGTAKMGGTC
nr:MAG TPA: hypothetical protein [Bacteriophage sp.]